MRELLSEVTASGYSATLISGDLIIEVDKATIVVGLEASGFNAYIQTSSEAGPEYSTAENLTKESVLALCRQHALQTV